MRRIANRPEQLWLLLAGVALLGLLLAGGLYVHAKHRWAVSTLETVGPRYARLAGLRDGGEQIEALTQALRENLSQYVHGAEGDPAQVGNGVLQRVRERASAAGLRVVSSQVLVPREEEGFSRVGLNLQIEGEWQPLVGLLNTLAAQRPMVYVEQAQFINRGGHTPDGPQTLSVTLNLFVLKELP